MNAPECLHHQMFDFGQLSMRLLGDFLESQCTFTALAAEHSFDERHQAYLLTQEFVALEQYGLIVSDETVSRTPRAIKLRASPPPSEIGGATRQIFRYCPH